jgi:RNA polymerase sigma factor (sigma-70 family)
MIFPFDDTQNTDPADAALVEQALAGDRQALEKLIIRHQAWIYNIALRMVYLPQDAEDVTQEILIKMVTRLSTFRGESSFRTWLYRVVANHVLDMKKRRPEEILYSFADYADKIDAVPDQSWPPARPLPCDANLIVEETRLSCIAGMLLCLDRQKRLVFILGALLGVSDAIGSEIIGITRHNFRQHLSRGRRKIANFMNEKCGLVNPANSCHCQRKTTSLIDSGSIDLDHLHFTGQGARKLKELARQKSRQIDGFFEEKCVEIFRNSPMYNGPDFVGAMQELFDDRTFKETFNLDN